jgi:hypothetical protein
VACTAFADSTVTDHADRTRGDESMRTISGSAWRSPGSEGTPAKDGLEAKALTAASGFAERDVRCRAERTGRTVVWAVNLTARLEEEPQLVFIFRPPQSPILVAGGSIFGARYLGHFGASALHDLSDFRRRRMRPPNQQSLHTGIPVHNRYRAQSSGR